MEYYRYVPSPETDLMLAQLWARQQADNELGDLWGDPQFPLSAIYEASVPPRNELLYAIDKQGIWFAFWATPILRGALVTAYVRPDMRATVRAVRVFRNTLSMAVRAYGTVMGITRESLLPLHQRLGYSLAGRIPGILQGVDGFLVVRTATERERIQWQESSECSEAAPEPELRAQQLELALVPAQRVVH